MKLICSGDDQEHRQRPGKAESRLHPHRRSHLSHQQRNVLHRIPNDGQSPFTSFQFYALILDICKNSKKSEVEEFILPLFRIVFSVQPVNSG